MVEAVRYARMIECEGLGRAHAYTGHWQMWGPAHRESIAVENGGEAEVVLAGGDRSRIESVDDGSMGEKAHYGVEEDLVGKKVPAEAFVFGPGVPLVRKASVDVWFLCQHLPGAFVVIFPVPVSLRPITPVSVGFPPVRAHLASFGPVGQVTGGKLH